MHYSRPPWPRLRAWSTAVSRSVEVRQSAEEDLEEKGERSDRVRTRTKPARGWRGAGRGIGRLARPVVAAVACWPCCSRELAAARRLSMSPGGGLGFCSVMC